MFADALRIDGAPAPCDVTAVVEIARNGVTADGQHRFYSYDIDEAVRALAHLLSGF